MDTFVELLVEWGTWGLFVAAFISGSILPFSSEIVFTILLHMGLSPAEALISATLGNTLGGMTCYGIGRAGKSKWILKLGVTPEKLLRAQKFLSGKGALMGFFGFLPGLGEAIVVALGLMRSNFTLTSISMLVGKALRYLIIILAYEGVISFL